jgi:hypothetical protein
MRIVFPSILMKKRYSMTSVCKFGYGVAPAALDIRFASSIDPLLDMSGPRRVSRRQSAVGPLSFRASPPAWQPTWFRFRRAVRAVAHPVPEGCGPSAENGED